MLIVARYLDGRVIKGSTTDFRPANETFHVSPSSGRPAKKVSTRGLKAIFYVQSLDGDPDRPLQRDFPDQNGCVRARLWLRFLDGEQMAAWPVSPSLGEKGFWVLPADSNSNLEKAYVFRDAVDKILEGPEALKAARLESRKASTLTATTPPRIVAI